MRTFIQKQEVYLDKDRAMFLVEHETLVISDLHLGKSAHFRRSGFPVSNKVSQSDLERLSHLVSKYKAKTLIVTGDMFHHGINSDIDDFAEWRNTQKNLKIILVKGNHDLLDHAEYQRLNIEIHNRSYCLGPFCFIHEAPETLENDLYPISGHIHPGVSIVGKAKQRLRFPCFFFGKSYAVLPAFSEFTGLSIIKPIISDRMFAITDTKVIEI